MGRRKLTEKSWDDTFTYIGAVADALALAAADGDNEVGALQKKVEPLLVRWESLDVERRAKQRAIGRANALVRRRDMQADTSTAELNLDTLAEVRQNKGADLYTRLFPDGYFAAVKPALESQLPIMREIVRQLKAAETPAALRKKHLAAMETALDRGQAAVTGREDAYAEAGRVTARLASFRDDADRALMGVEGSLTTLAAERKLDERWVESFFPAPEAAPRKAKKPAEPR